MKRMGTFGLTGILASTYRELEREKDTRLGVGSQARGREPVALSHHVGLFTRMRSVGQS